MKRSYDSVYDKKGRAGFFRILGIVLLAVGLLAVLLCLYIRFCGVRTTGTFRELTVAKKTYINHYDYTADGKTYDYTVRTSFEKAAKPGDTIAVFYLEGDPTVTYNSTAFYLGLIISFIGGLCIMSDFRRKQ
ncbi:MAG: hypothetical protein IJH80_00165 [Ruminococcus sp.]|nr:hypothetical protein [Ruminococcus sp.]